MPTQSISGVIAKTLISVKIDSPVECIVVSLNISAIMAMIKNTLIGTVCRKKNAENAENPLSFLRFLIFISRMSCSVISLPPILT